MVFCLHTQVLPHPCLPPSHVPICVDISPLPLTQGQQGWLEEETWMVVTRVFLPFSSAWNMNKSPCRVLCK